jgi:hypothetical protein
VANDDEFSEDAKTMLFLWISYVAKLLLIILQTSFTCPIIEILSFEEKE